MPARPALALLGLLVLAACSSSPTCTDPAGCDCAGGTCSLDPCSANFPVAGPLKIAVLDVGQGDSIAVIAPDGCAALIDGGPTGSGPTVRSYLREQGVTRLDFAVASHYHADHIGGLNELESGEEPVAVSTLYDRGTSPAPVTSSTTYDVYAATFSHRRQTASPGDTWILCEQVCFRVLETNASGEVSDDENALSVVLKLNYGPFTMLLGGDLTGEIEPLVAPDVGEVDVYKVHHHGSATSSTGAFLSALRPSASLVSVGWDNTFGHPSASTLARLEHVDSAIWRTENSAPLGPIEVTVEGTTEFTVSQGSESASYAIKAAGGD